MKIDKKGKSAYVTITKAELAANPKLAKLLKAEGEFDSDFGNPFAERANHIRTEDANSPPHLRGGDPDEEAEAEISSEFETAPSGVNDNPADFVSDVEKVFTEHGMEIPDSFRKRLEQEQGFRADDAARDRLPDPELDEELGIGSGVQTNVGVDQTYDPNRINDPLGEDALDQTTTVPFDEKEHSGLDKRKFPANRTAPMTDPGEIAAEDAEADEEFQKYNPRPYDDTWALSTGKLTRVSNQSQFVNDLAKVLAQVNEKNEKKLKDEEKPDFSSAHRDCPYCGHHDVDGATCPDCGKMVRR